MKKLIVYYKDGSKSEFENVDRFFFANGYVEVISKENMAVERLVYANIFTIQFV